MAAEPYTVHLSDEVLEDLQRRLVNARLPQDFANDDWGYGVNGAYLRELVDYWIEGYDWRAVEREINAFANYRTEIQGVPIHFIHERGKGPDPKPLILSHGWPWCFWDFHELVGPLTDPAAHGGDERDAFDVVLPSLPGFGFSAPHSVPGINFWRTADLWAELMGDVLGYDRFLAHGGDWGNLISAQLGHKYADRVGAIHITGAIPLTVLANPGGASLLGQRTTTPEQAARNPDLVEPGVLRPRPGSAHVAVQLNEPQTISYALHDSPVGLCAWILDRRYWWSDNDRGERAVEQAFSKDHLLTLMMLYWATGRVRDVGAVLRGGGEEPVASLARPASGGGSAHRHHLPGAGHDLAGAGLDGGVLQPRLDAGSGPGRPFRRAGAAGGDRGGHPRRAASVPVGERSAGALLRGEKSGGAAA